MGDVCAHIDFLKFLIIFIICSSYANSLNNSRQTSFFPRRFSYKSLLIIFELSGVPEFDGHLENGNGFAGL